MAAFRASINEPDYFLLYFLRNLSEASGFTRHRKGFLRATPPGREMLEEARGGDLQAILFRNVWCLGLGLGRSLHPGWPLRDIGIGIVLWSLSVAANAWETPERLTRLCTVPINGVIEAQWDSGAMAMDARVLRPLLWFGLLEQRLEKIEGSLFGERHFYRKTSLFDRLISFDVQLEAVAGSQH